MGVIYPRCSSSPQQSTHLGIISASAKASGFYNRKEAYLTDTYCWTDMGLSFGRCLAASVFKLTVAVPGSTGRDVCLLMFNVFTHWRLDTSPSFGLWMSPLKKATRKAKRRGPINIIRRSITSEPDWQCLVWGWQPPHQNLYLHRQCPRLQHFQLRQKLKGCSDVTLPRAPIDIARDVRLVPGPLERD